MNETTEKPLVYLVLGAPDSGRRELVADLIDSGVSAAESPVVFVAETEVEPGAAVSRAQLASWTWNEENERERITATWPAGATMGFFIADSRRSPVDQIEAFKPWMKAQGVEMARVITVYHCELVARHDRLRLWYDACVHFSDIVLLNRREGVENKWISELRTRFAKACMPCLVEMVKKGKVANPPLVLDLQVRRFSHWFDDQDPWMAMIDSETEIVIEEGAEDVDEDEQDFDEVDPYLARHPSGRRAKEVPSIASILDGN